MKIVCEACEVRAAEIVCCACAGEEAALCVCADCDFKLHATPSNLPLNPPHQRLLLSTSNLPNCDACQGRMGFFFCVEERKMLCRECDVSKHLIAPKSAHQRIFLPLVKVDSLDFANKVHHNVDKPSIDLPESSHTQLMSSDEFFEFEGDALYDWPSIIQLVDHSRLMNEDVVEEGPEFLLPVVHGFHDHVIDSNKNNHHHVLDSHNNSDIAPRLP